MSSLIISSASRSSPRIFIYHSSHIILIPSSFHSIILAFFTFPLIHFTMVLFAISSKLIFTHFIYHTLLLIIPSSFPSYFTSITLITTHLCFSFSFVSMFSIHSFPTIPSHSYILLPHSIHIVSSLLIYVSQLWDKYLVCSDSRYPILIWCVDRKHSQSVRRNCFCFLCMIREQ